MEMTEKQKNAFNLGRWFVVIADLQAKSDQRSIFDGTVLKDIKAMQRNPQNTFVKYHDNSQHYVKKLSRLSTGSAVWFTKLLAEISTEITEFQTAPMTTEQKAFFALGLETQKKILFTKKTSEENE